jgi:enoyl-CoA hydratase/carnithine racemase
VETIQVARAEGVVTVTLDRPAKKNAVNDVMWRELLAAFTEVAASAGDRVLVLTGAGGACCSGADLSPAGAAEWPSASTAWPSPPSPRSTGWRPAPA